LSSTLVHNEVFKILALAGIGLTVSGELSPQLSVISLRMSSPNHNNDNNGTRRNQ
jgi:hypothetical protein